MTETDIIRGFDVAMRNSYSIILGYKEFDELTGGDMVMFAHDIEEPIGSSIIDFLIEYFEDQEEYEKCQQLINIKDSL